jgi:hypothetical protein
VIIQFLKNKLLIVTITTLLNISVGYGVYITRIIVSELVGIAMLTLTAGENQNENREKENY